MLAICLKIPIKRIIEEHKYGCFQNNQSLLLKQCLLFTIDFEYKNKQKSQKAAAKIFSTKYVNILAKVLLFTHLFESTGLQSILYILIK